MAAFAWLVAHGGIPGAIAEGTIALAVVALFVAIWLRERSHDDDRDRVSERKRKKRGEG